MVRIGKRSIEVEGMLRVEVIGTLTGPSSDKLMHLVESLLHTDNRPVILNLGAVREIDLRGLGTLLEIAALAGRRRADLRIVGPFPSVDLLVTVRILTLDNWFQSEADAILGPPMRSRAPRAACAGEHASVAA